ncbi:MAG TPA: hypothetical protein VE572_00230 [Nitrososphaeraceae archaeon]|nr:hypothetical protein [Nitrososphaeraceae archaeon]
MSCFLEEAALRQQPMIIRVAATARGRESEKKKNTSKGIWRDGQILANTVIITAKVATEHYKHDDA